MTLAALFGTVSLFALALVGGASPGPEFISAWGGRGSGPGQFDRPVAIAVGPLGDVYVGDSRQRYVQRFSSDGQFLGQCGIGVALCPVAISVSVDAVGRVIVGDGAEHALRVFAQDLTPITAWGLPAAYGVAVGPAGDIFVAEGPGCAVSRWTVEGGLLMRWGGGTGGQPGQFSNAWGIAVDQTGYVYVADYGNSRVQKFTSEGEFVLSWGGYGTGPGQFIFPTSVSITPTGTVLVTDPYNDRLQEFSPNGVLCSKWGIRGVEPGMLSEPYGVATHGPFVYVADTGNSRIQRFGVLPTPTQPSTWGRLKALYK